MPSRKEEEPEQFKVVDRRLFTADGERRADVEEPPEPAKAQPQPQTPPPSAAPPPPPRPASAPEAAKAATFASGPEMKSAPANAMPDAAMPDTAMAGVMADGALAEDAAAAAGMPQGPVQFEHLVMSLISSAMYQLGMAAQPGQPPPRPDLPAAQETIDLLGVLEKKTQGNLTPEEIQLLSGGLQELRLAFVEISRRAGRIR